MRGDLRIVGSAGSTIEVLSVVVVVVVVAAAAVVVVVVVVVGEYHLFEGFVL